jgi:DNA-binding NarL/FixJ family response regulator
MSIRQRSESERVRVLIADDQVLFAEGLKTILEARASDIEVVGIARNGKEAVDLTAAVHPDIVLLDVRMPVMDGVDATRQLHAQFPEVRVMMLTTFDDDEYVKNSLAFGAIGYLLKNRPPAELIASIRAVRSGILQIDPAVSKALFHDVDEKTLDDSEFIRNMNSLTPREKDVLRYLVLACGNQEIALKMQIAEQTVRNYVSTIYSKLGIVNRIEIMRYVDKIRFYLEHF